MATSSFRSRFFFAQWYTASLPPKKLPRAENMNKENFFTLVLAIIIFYFFSIRIELGISKCAHANQINNTLDRATDRSREKRRKFLDFFFWRELGEIAEINVKQVYARPLRHNRITAAAVAATSVVGFEFRVERVRGWSDGRSTVILFGENQNFLFFGNRIITKNYCV